MAQRSPYNERYGKYTKPAGSARKSASSAKPKRASADESVKPKPTRGRRSLASAPKRAPRPARQPAQRIPMTPELKAYTRVNLILIGVAFVAAVALLLMQVRHLDLQYKQVVSLLWGVWAASIGGALYLQFGPIRKARAAAAEQARSGKKKAEGPAGKAPKGDEAKATAEKPQAPKGEKAGKAAGKKEEAAAGDAGSTSEDDSGKDA